MDEKTKRKLIAMSGVMISIFISALDQTVVNTALPSITAELGGFALYTWVFTAYMLASTSSVPIFGKISDIYGRRPLLAIGVIIFVSGSAMCGVAPTMTILICCRVIQGIGAGIIMPNAFSVVGDLFSPAERGKWQGLTGAAFGLASIVGPLVGGYLTDNLSWRWVFFVNVPIGAIALVVIWTTIPHVKHEVKASIDYLGGAALVLFAVPMLLAFSTAGEFYAWGSPQIIGMLTLSAIALVLFLWVENRAKEPIIPLKLFKNSIFAMSVFIVFLTGVGLFGPLTFIPLFIQGVTGASATASGIIMMPMMFTNVSSNFLSGQLLSRWGRYRLLSIGGFFLIASGMGLLSTLDPGVSHGEVIRDIVIMGAGLGITMPLFVLVVQNALPYEFLGVATSAIQFFRQIGGTIGVALMGSLMTVSLNRQLLHASSIFSGSDLTVIQANAGKFQTMVQRPETLGISAHGQALLQQVLSTSITNVFLVGSIVVATGFIASFFLKEIPLRSYNEDFGAEESFEPGKTKSNICSD